MKKAKGRLQQSRSSTSMVKRELKLGTAQLTIGVWQTFGRTRLKDSPIRYVPLLDEPFGGIILFNLGLNSQ